MIPSTKAKQRQVLRDAMERLTAIDQELEVVLNMVASVLAEMHNRSPIAKRPAQKGRMAPAILRRDWRNGHSMQTISQHYGVSIGRVSEAVRGKRQ